MHIILSSQRDQKTGKITHVRDNSSFHPATDKHQIKFHRPDLKNRGREFKAAALEVTSILQDAHQGNVFAVSVKRKGTPGSATDFVYINRDFGRNNGRHIGFVAHHHGWLARKISEIPALKSPKMPKWVQNLTDLPRMTGHVTPNSVTMVEIDPDHVFMRVKSGVAGLRREYYTMNKSAFNALYDLK